MESPSSMKRFAVRVTLVVAFKRIPALPFPVMRDEAMDALSDRKRVRPAPVLLANMEEAMVASCTKLRSAPEPVPRVPETSVNAIRVRVREEARRPIQLFWSRLESMDALSVPLNSTPAPVLLVARTDLSVMLEPP